MSILGRSIKIVRFHSTTHITGIGNVGTSVDLTQVSEKFKGVSLTHVEGGVLLKGKNVEAFFPASSVMNTELVPQAPESASPSKK